MTNIEDMKFNQLVDWAAGHILKGLLKGEFERAVWVALDTAIHWKMEKDGKHV